MPGEEATGGDSQTESIKKVIWSALESSDSDLGMEVGEMMIVDDEETNEEFLEVVLAFSPTGDGFTPNTVLQASIPPTVGVFVQLVDQGFDYPMEVVVYAQHPDREFLPLMAFRASVQWAREHIHGNYTLEQIIAMVYDTVHGPESIEDSEDWVPEYDLDWRNVDEPEEIGAGVDFGYWSSGKVPYPDDED